MKMLQVITLQRRRDNDTVLVKDDTALCVQRVTGQNDVTLGSFLSASVMPRSIRSTRWAIDMSEAVSCAIRDQDRVVMP